MAINTELPIKKVKYNGIEIPIYKEQTEIRLEEKSITPTKSIQNVIPTSGFDGLSKVVVNAIPNNYIDTTDATASSTEILSGKSAYVNGVKVNGQLIIQKYYTGSSEPSTSLGNNGDLYLKV